MFVYFVLFFKRNNNQRNSSGKINRNHTPLCKVHLFIFLSPLSLSYCQIGQIELGNFGSQAILAIKTYPGYTDVDVVSTVFGQTFIVWYANLFFNPNVKTKGKYHVTNCEQHLPHTTEKLEIQFLEDPPISRANCVNILFLVFDTTLDISPYLWS